MGTLRAALPTRQMDAAHSDPWRESRLAKQRVGAGPQRPPPDSCRPRGYKLMPPSTTKVCPVM
jgi:hypothetical protein